MKVLYANPARHDYLHATLLDGLIRRTDIEVVCLQEGNYGGTAARCFAGDAEAAIAMLAEFDAVVIGSGGKHARFTGPVGTLMHAPKPRADQRWVLVDSGDLGSLPRIDVPWTKFAAVVKRELYVQDASLGTLLSVAFARRMRHSVEAQYRAHPLLPFPNVQCNLQARPAIVARRRTWRLPSSVAVRCEPIGLEPRIVQEFNETPQRLVTCTLTPNVDARRRIRRHLDGREDVRCELIDRSPDDPVDLVATGAVVASLPKQFSHNSAYHAWLHAHRASINFPGAGWDTARCWEILGAGALLITKRVSLDLPVPLIDGQHFVGFDTLAELDEAIRFAVSDSPEVDVIRRRGHEFALANYSSDAMAERFVTHELRGGR